MPFTEKMDTMAAKALEANSAPKPPQLTPVEHEFDGLFQSLRSLQERVELLANRLSPVLSQAPTAVKQEPGKPTDVNSSPLRMKLETASATVCSVEGILAALIAGLEI